MGREVKRVPMDFGWPKGEVWHGYLLPERLRQPACGACDGRGETAARRWVSQVARLALMLDDDLRDQARGRPMHPYLHDTGSHAHGVRPSADIAEFGEGLAGRKAGLMGHDALSTWAATGNLIKAAGLDSDVWGWCPACAGEGLVEAYRGQAAEAEAWEPFDPPEGEGWQMWETTSEGSPQTPVFATAEELADHCAETGASWFGNSGATREQWLNSFTGGEIGGMVQIAPGVVMM